MDVRRERDVLHDMGWNVSQGGFSEDGLPARLMKFVFQPASLELRLSTMNEKSLVQGF